MTEPIPISGYECPVCRHMMTSTTGYPKELAEAHVNLPLDTPLPEGLVFRLTGYNTDHYIISGEYPLGDHSHSQLYSSFIEGDIVRSNTINSREFKSRLKNGIHRLLTPKEFQKLKIPDHYRKFAPIRTTPELEAIVLASSIPNQLQ